MVSLLRSAFKNEYSKWLLRSTGLRKARTPPRRAGHYRMPVLEEAGGCLVLGDYRGPEIPRNEWEDLTYTTYSSDPSTFFAPITSATGALELKGFWRHGKSDLDGVWTENAERCPTIVKWLESIGARFGRVQLLRMEPTTLRECRWGLHLDSNNGRNPETNGWVVRLWMELTDDPDSALVVRRGEFDRRSEVRIPLPRSSQVVLDSETVYHGGYHRGPATRYAVIVSLESGPPLERWIRSQLPDFDVAASASALTLTPSQAAAPRR
jgi:hypothetical protein